MAWQGMQRGVDTHERIKAWLTAQGAAFRVLEHAPAGSAADYQRTLGTRLEQQAKALLLRHKGPQGKGHVVVTVQAQKQVDLEAVRAALGAEEVRLADRGALRDVTGCNFGELPPLGRMFRLRLLMDRDLLGEPEVYFNAGRLDRSIAMDPKVIAGLEDPVYP